MLDHYITLRVTEEALQLAETIRQRAAVIHLTPNELTTSAVLRSALMAGLQMMDEKSRKMQSE